MELLTVLAIVVILVLAFLFYTGKLTSDIAKAIMAFVITFVGVLMVTPKDEPLTWRVFAFAFVTAGGVWFTPNGRKRIG